MSAPLILVVDDEPGIVKLCERLLTKAGFRVSTFTHPQKAMEALHEEHVDLILADIRMPDFDGFDVVAYAKRVQPDIAALIMTGFGTVETAIKALRQGVDGLILKPFETGEELVETARQALADNQRKRDAAHMQALRPLFDVTKAFLEETRPEKLPDLIVSTVSNHLRCNHAGYYQYEQDNLKLLAKRGKNLLSNSSKQILQVIEDTSNANRPKLVHATTTGDSLLKERLLKLELSSIVYVPILQSAVKGFLYAARGKDAPPFREIDLDMLQILAQQASVAMENAKLYAELRDYIQKVEESQQALLQAEKMASAGRLTASIAHEINNPLQAVQNCLHLAGRDDLPVEKQDEYFTLAQDELTRLMSTVRRMLDFYRPGAVQPKSIDISDTLQHVLGLMSAQLSQREIVVTTSFSNRLPNVLAVDSQLQQVFLNLTLNAYDAMPEGGTLKISARKRKDRVEIFFQDSGTGIPEEQRATIFEPFISSKDNGTGLGLTVSYNIMTMHGGDLELFENNEDGACFLVRLPIGGK